jgi:hypothetical protein
MAVAAVILDDFGTTGLFHFHGIDRKRQPAGLDKHKGVNL